MAAYTGGIHMDYSPLVISLKTSFFATLMAFMLGLLAASQVRKTKRLRGFIDGVLILPMVLPPTVLGFALLVVFGKNGMLGRILDTFGMNIIFSWEATLIAATVAAFPLMYRSILSAFDDIDANLIYAAKTLGMSNVEIFWKIVFPNALSGITGGIVLGFARAMGEFGATIMVAGNIQGETRTIPIAIYTAVQSGDRATAYRWTGIIIMISLLMIVLMNCLNRQKDRKVRWW
jgi:molybdate transport system permease protein